jgi:hypothetical protein
MSHEVNEALNKLEGWTKAFNENGAVDESTKVTIKEAFFTADAPILFPKVMSNVLREAAEPEYSVSALFDVVRTDGRVVEFPAVNSIQASEIPEGQEYPEQQLAFAKQAEGKVTKKGVKVNFTEEVISDSQWDIIGLHVRAAGRAMARLKEQIAVDRFTTHADVVFNNAGAEPNTTGLGSSGVANNTLSWDDLMDMAAALHTDHHSPTDLLMNHLAWPLFAKSHGLNGMHDLMRLNPTSLPANEQAAYASVAPLGLNVILSRFVRLASGITDIYLIDRNEIGANLVREEMSTDEFDDPTRDIRALKLRERYDLVVYGDGEGIKMAKEVAVAPSYEITLVSNVL